MKRVLLSELRDQNTRTDQFRRASDQLARLLCAETVEKLISEEVTIETPVGTAQGVEIPNNIMVVPILRAGLALLPAFMEAIPNVSVGVVGLERDEKTAIARTYYKKLPKFLTDKAVIIDPMLATGGSACMAVEFLIEAGYQPENIYFTGVVAAQEGFDRLAQVIPETNITVAAIDPVLNEKKYIVPGLGDYGDRYFGTLRR